MKKTLLATAIAGAMAFSATAAQAATVYDQDGTSIDLGGRIALGISNQASSTAGDDADSAEFRNIYSRLHLTMSQQVSQDLRAFGYVQWRFDGDERNTDSGFTEVRNSYIGLEHARLGTVMAGNFDGIYYANVINPFDVYIDSGLEFTAGGYNDRGDSIAYFTPDLSGFQAFISAKHYSGNNIADSDSEVSTQGGVKYETGGLRLSAGWAEQAPVANVAGYIGGAPTTVTYVDEDGNTLGTGPEPSDRSFQLENDDTDVRYAATASYAFNDMFSARLGYEDQDDIDTEVIGLGGTVNVNQWKFHADVYNIDTDGESSRTAFAGGAYYNLTPKFDVFTEVNDKDLDGVDTYVLAGARYFF
ncbi:MAG: porin [Pseudomonadota bacterium]